MSSPDLGIARPLTLASALFSTKIVQFTCDGFIKLKINFNCSLYKLKKVEDTLMFIEKWPIFENYRKYWLGEYFLES